MTTPANTEGNPPYRETSFGPAGRFRNGKFEKAEPCRRCTTLLYPSDTIVRVFRQRYGSLPYCVPCAASLFPKQ